MDNFTDMKAKFAAEVCTMTEQQFYNLLLLFDDENICSDKYGIHPEQYYSCSKCAEEHIICPHKDSDDDACYKAFVEFCQKNIRDDQLKGASAI